MGRFFTDRLSANPMKSIPFYFLWRNRLYLVANRESFWIFTAIHDGILFIEHTFIRRSWTPTSYQYNFTISYQLYGSEEKVCEKNRARHLQTYATIRIMITVKIRFSGKQSIALKSSLNNENCIKYDSRQIPPIASIAFLTIGILYTRNIIAILHALYK